MATSAQDLIRALKAPSDPPQPGGPHKIQIATEAWENQSLYIPSKEETVTEWILTRLLKDKDKEGDANPLLDIRYWRLLKNIISPSKVQNGAASASSSSWISSLVSRVPVVPIASAFGLLCVSRIATLSATLASEASKCLAMLWPHAVGKAGSDSLLECFGVFLAVAQGTLVDQLGIPECIALVTLSYRTSFSNSNHKKKLYSAFVQKHFPLWLNCINTPTLRNHAPLSRDIYEAGIETLFNTETTRLVQDEASQGSIEGALNKLVRSQSENILASLSQMFRSFVVFSRRSRVAPPGQVSNSEVGSKTEQSRSLSMSFFVTCDGLLSQIPEGNQVWTARVALLSIVDSENLFDSRDDVSKKVLMENGEYAIRYLSSLPREHGDEATLAFQTLSILTRIDYELIPEPLIRVVPGLTRLPSLPAAHEYLGHLFEYHTKTRTMNELALAILRSFGSPIRVATKNDSRHLYDLASSGPLQTQGLLARLSTVVNGFLTPGQVVDLAESVMAYIKISLTDFHESAAQLSASNGQGSRKKQKREAQGEQPSSGDPEFLAVAISGSAKVATAILTSLPLRILPDDTRGKLLETIQEFYNLVVVGSVKKTLRKLDSDDQLNTWGWQIVLSSLLRLRYYMLSAPQLEILLEVEAKFVPRLVAAVKLDDVLPELQIEILRSLLLEVSRGRCDPSIAFEKVLRILEVPHAQNELWSGRLHNLNTHTAQTPIAIFHLLSTRWLPLFDTQATPEQLERLASVMLKSGTPTPHGALLTMESVFHAVLRNAEFWELDSLTDSLMCQVTKALEALDSIDPTKLLQGLRNGGIPQVSLDADSIAASYLILLYTPTEAIPRTHRADLLRRAVVADVYLGCNAARNHPGHDIIQTITIIREFIRRTLSQSASEEPPPREYLDYLMDNVILSPQEDATLASTTLGQLKHYFSSLILSAIRGDEERLLAIIRSCTGSKAFNIPSEQTNHGDLRLDSVVCLFDALTTGHSRSHLNDPTIRALEDLYERLLATLLPQIISPSLQLSGSANESSVSILDAWHRLHLVRRWLALEGPTLPRIGRALAARLLSCSNVTPIPLYSSVLSIALEELNPSAGSQNQEDDLTSICAIYVAFSLQVKDSEKQYLDSCLSKATKSFSVPDFSSMLKLVLDGLSHSSISKKHVSLLVDLSNNLIHHAPEGTLKLTQAHFTHCLGLFVNNAIYLEDIILRTRILRLIERQVNDRPAAVRTSDISNIWSLFGKLLASSSQHEADTDKDVYRNIVSILNALVRLRRDLILPTLPHLGIMLRRLIISLKSLSPQLGGKQTRLVAGTLPCWINPAHPLGVEESKAAARLLTTLTTKTVIRTHGTSELQKAESLARPFSKHASAVLIAYIDASNDPLCILPSEIRRELQPGLFALCEMMGEQNRDAMMVTVDSGGKTIMKTLWREYEKQRYTGKG